MFIAIIIIFYQTSLKKFVFRSNRSSICAGTGSTEEQSEASKSVWLVPLLKMNLTQNYSWAQCCHGVKISFLGFFFFCLFDEDELNVYVTIATSEVMTRSSSWEVWDVRLVSTY